MEMKKEHCVFVCVATSCPELMNVALSVTGAGIFINAEINPHRRPRWLSHKHKPSVQLRHRLCIYLAVCLNVCF